MLIDLTDKEVRKIGELRYQKTISNNIIIVSCITLIAVFILIYLWDKLNFINAKYIIEVVGIAWFVYFYYQLEYKAGKAGKMFLKEQQEKKVSGKDN